MRKQDFPSNFLLTANMRRHAVSGL